VKKITLNIDDKEIIVEEGMTILQVARGAGIDIPTLCYHEKLEPYGVCRLCLVEIGTPPKTRLVVSCVYPAADGLVVKTKSERVIQTRKMLSVQAILLAIKFPIILSFNFWLNLANERSIMPQ